MKKNLSLSFFLLMFPLVGLAQTECVWGQSFLGESGCREARKTTYLGDVSDQYFITENCGYLYIYEAQGWFWVYIGASDASIYLWSWNESSYFWTNSEFAPRYYNYTTGNWHEFSDLTPDAPEGLVQVKGGEFDMGNDSGSGDADESPVHTVTIDRFFIQPYELTNELAVSILNYAASTFDIGVSGGVIMKSGQEVMDLNEEDSSINYSSYHFSVDSGKEDYPCNHLTWFGAIVLANYYSEMEGLTPCYDLSSWSCDFTANGYRLPTEAEWEYAASERGSENDYIYSGSDSLSLVGWYFYNSSNKLHPVGQKAANSLGIYDMSGNVWEYCWDRYADDYYANSAEENPTGPESGSKRVIRGGGYEDGEGNCQIRNRSSVTFLNGFSDVGVRFVRR